MTRHRWRRTTRSAGNGNCVEAASCSCHGIAIRDSKLPTTGSYPTLSISRADWTAFLSNVRDA